VPASSAGVRRLSRKRLFLIDGMSHIYRAYYAIRNLSNSKGIPTNAIYGFTSMLRKLIDEEAPDFLGVAFDLEGPTVRHEKFEAYKATRKPMPEDLAAQLPYIRKVCEAFRVPVISCPGFEADDVLGTLSRKAEEAGLSTFIVTSDKDMLQLVADKVFIVDPMKDNRILDAGKVVERLGVTPQQVPDLLGLWGDSSDNIPGAPGIGEKGAKELIRTFGSLENLLQNPDQVKRKAYQQSLRDNAELIRVSRELATIRRDLPLDLNLDSLLYRPPDREAAFQLFSELEFKSLMAEFVSEPRHGTPEPGWLEPDEAAAFLSAQQQSQNEVYLVLMPGGESPGHGAAVAACLQSEVDKPPVLIDLKNHDSVRPEWDRFLGSPALKLVCWDGKLIGRIQEYGSVTIRANIEDVMLMAFLTASHIGDYSLRRWALDELHRTLPENRNRNAALLNQGDGDIGRCLGQELAALRDLHKLLSPRLDELGLLRLYRDIELPVMPVLAAMECAGVKVDAGIMRALSAEMEGQIGALTSRIYEATGTEFNINSPKQLGEILFERLNLPTLKKTKKTKGYSTDQAVLEELAETYELPRLILEYRQLAKLKSTYVDILPTLIHAGTGRVHTSFNQTGTSTGRLSSSDPNLQNIPIRTELGRRIRSAFVAETGHMLISADYSQVELRVLAHLSEDEGLIDAFLRDEDIHDRTAEEVFGNPDSDHRAEYRRRAKVINFGIVYGLSAFGLAQRLGISRDDAEAFIDAYFRRYPGVRRWLDRTVEEARQTGIVRTLFGRIRPIPDIHSRNYAVRQFAERTAVNSPIQGTAADIVKIAMIRIWKTLQDKGLSSKILLQVHDELLLECPLEEVEEAKSLLRREMEGAASLKIPLRVEIGMGKSWADVK
jgi:DNA polymerase-1